jgi:hypothetical protein
MLINSPLRYTLLYSSEGQKSVAGRNLSPNATSNDIKETVKSPGQRKPRKRAVKKEVKEFRKTSSTGVPQGYPSGNTGIVGEFETEMEVDPYKMT